MPASVGNRTVGQRDRHPPDGRKVAAHHGGHSELADYFYQMLEAIANPEAVCEGAARELLAARQVEPGKHLVVVYI